ncbi:MAG: hypothetical protein IPJ34_04800 [Myxococcales bacterium]|nr:hypothetical protein [Myxococcales bacterium]
MLTGPEKAVLFLLALDEDVARPVVAELGEEELRRLRTVASTMRDVPTKALDEAFKEFVERSDAAVAVPRGGLPYLRRLATAALGEKRTRIVFEDGVTSPVSRLEHAPPTTLAAMLEKEPPQIVGVMLASLAPETAAAAFAAMPPERQVAVVTHVSRMTDVPAHVLEDVATALADELPSAEVAASISVDGLSRAAQLLNAAGRRVSDEVIATLEGIDDNLARQIREAMFTFDDLRRLSARGMRDLLREVPTERLTVALKGASEEVMNAILAGLSSRAAQMIKDDLELMSGVRKSEVEKARAEIVQVALRLEGEGKLDLGRDGE